jgi:hypothetical protein
MVVEIMRKASKSLTSGAHVSLPIDRRRSNSGHTIQTACVPPSVERRAQIDEGWRTGLAHPLFRIAHARRARTYHRTPEPPRGRLRSWYHTSFRTQRANQDFIHCVTTWALIVVGGVRFGLEERLFDRYFKSIGPTERTWYRLLVKPSVGDRDDGHVVDERRVSAGVQRTLVDDERIYGRST